MSSPHWHNSGCSVSGEHKTEMPSICFTTTWEKGLGDIDETKMSMKWSLVNVGDGNMGVHCTSLSTSVNR